MGFVYKMMMASLTYINMQYKKQARVSSSGSLKRFDKTVNHKSVSNWTSDIKKIVSHYPTFRNTEVSKKISVKQSKSKGKLHLGVIVKPTIILSKEQRLNPLAKRTVISEDILNKKGIFHLANIGVISKLVNCTDLLNNKYELIIQKADPRSTVSKDYNQGFITDPILSIESQYFKNKKNIEQIPQEQSKVEKAIKIRQYSKKVVVAIKDEPKPFFFEIIEEKPKLSIINFKIEQSKIYVDLLKKMKMSGLEISFQIYIKKIQKFTLKYNLKKIKFIPDLNQTRKLTEKTILHSIINHKLYGIDLKLKGSHLDIFTTLVLMKVQRIRFRQLKLFIQKLDQIKNKFKTKRYFREMTEQRWKLIQFKMGSFQENQRRFVENQTSNFHHPEVQIHLIATALTEHQLSTFYKWPERRKIELTRLYNNTCNDLILILNKQDNLDYWLKDIASIENTQKTCRIHVFYASINAREAEQCSDLYFGLGCQTIRGIKALCKGKRTVIIPYDISRYLPRISELFQVNLFAGTFTEESNQILLDQQSLKQAIIQVSSAKFKKISKSANQINQFYSSKLNKIQLTALLLSSKSYFKTILKGLRFATPITIFNSADTNDRDFYKQLTANIISQKQYSRWIFKTNNSSFSRGLAYFQTQSLKIIKETKKKAFVREEDLQHISKIMESILAQKLSLPHTSLLTNEEFLTNFKKQGGYVEGLIENCTSLNIFGRIEANGNFTFLGTCKKYFAENICFGASYPASEVTEDMLNKATILSKRLYELNMFGYLTYQLILQEKTKLFYFIDIIPHLEQFSSFHFYYSRMLNLQPVGKNSFVNRLKKHIFYIPFIDNNGNRCASSKEFSKLLLEKKIVFDKAKMEGNKYFWLNEQMDVLSLICFGQSENVAIRLALDGLRHLIENGGEFNKFDKRYKNSQCDGLYIRDMIWKMTQVKSKIAQK